jgi:hypothetical protein
MSQSEAKTPEPRTAEGSEMIRLMRQGVAEALREHKRLGQSVAVWDRESRQIVHVRPEDIVIPEIESSVVDLAQPSPDH